MKISVMSNINSTQIHYVDPISSRNGNMTLK